MLFRLFLRVVSLLNYKAWFGEKVWVPSPFMGQGEGRYLRVGTKVFDNRGRLCTVRKVGKIGALRRLSHTKTAETLTGWSLRKLIPLRHKLWSSREWVFRRAMVLGWSLRFRWMTWKFRCVVAWFRVNKFFRDSMRKEAMAKGYGMGWRKRLKWHFQWYGDVYLISLYAVLVPSLIPLALWVSH